MATVVEAALRSLLLALAVWSGLRVFRVRNVVAQKIAWGLVLASAVLMPVLAPWLARMVPSSVAVVLPRYVQAQPPAQIEATLDPAPARQPVGLAPVAVVIAPPPHAVSPHFSKTAPPPEVAPSLNTRPIDLPAVSSPALVDAAPQQSSPLPIAISLATLVTMLYLGVTSALLLRLFYGLACATSLFFTAERIPMSGSLPYTGTLRLRSSRAVASPVTIGSAVVLPASHTEWDPEKLRIVLAHERSHIRQGDFYLQLLASLYAALVWFSPLGWWLKRELSDLAETISDRAGLEQAASTTSYARILLEFAAAPRPTVLGVAMARTGSLSRRIERLLNDKAFGQAFASGRRRALVAVVLVPVALLVTTAMIRVQAAQDVQPASSVKVAAPAPAAQSTPTAGEAENPEPAAAPELAREPDVEVRADEPVAPKAPVAVIAPVPPSMAPLPRLAVVAPLAPVSPAAPSMMATLPKVTVLAPMAVVAPLPPTPAMLRLINGSRVLEIAQAARSENDHEHTFYYSNDGESYAVIRGDRRESMNFSGDIHTGDIDKARKQAHGDFLWFVRNGKQYFVDDPSVLSQIEAMYKPMEELGKQQEELGKRQEELGRQQEALGHKQEQASVPTPDMRKEMAELNDAMAKLQAKIGKTITQEELGDLQDKLGDLQGQLGELQGQIGSRQGEFGAQQGKLGVQQGRLGAEQGRLGAEQGRIAREADRKVRSMIDESLQNGKAHPVN